MVKQKSKPKTSSEVEENLFLPRDLDTLLTDLANLHDRGHERFWAWNVGLRKKFWGLVTGDELTVLRDQLRRIWAKTTPLEEKNSILTVWIQSGPTRDRQPFLPRFQWGRIIANRLNFRAELTLAVLNRSRQLAYCQNPECPVPYFLSKRKTQKYCERGDCTAFAQRRYALDWWRENRGVGGKKRKSQKRERTEE